VGNPRVILDQKEEVHPVKSYTYKKSGHATVRNLSAIRNLKLIKSCRGNAFGFSKKGLLAGILIQSVES
jgi:hypothetical protein